MVYICEFCEKACLKEFTNKRNCVLHISKCVAFKIIKENVF